MAAGGEAERAALEAQRAKMAAPSEPTDDPGRTDNPHGTGVGYAGEGSSAYGTQEADMSADNQKRTGEGGHSASTPQRQAEQQQISSSNIRNIPHPARSRAGGNSGRQQSTGSKPPTQGTGSTRRVIPAAALRGHSTIKAARKVVAQAP